MSNNYNTQLQQNKYTNQQSNILNEIATNNQILQQTEKMMSFPGTIIGDKPSITRFTSANSPDGGITPTNNYNQPNPITTQIQPPNPYIQQPKQYPPQVQYQQPQIQPQQLQHQVPVHQQPQPQQQQQHQQSQHQQYQSQQHIQQSNINSALQKVMSVENFQQTTEQNNLENGFELSEASSDVEPRNAKSHSFGRTSNEVEPRNAKSHSFDRTSNDVEYHNQIGQSSNEPSRMDHTGNNIHHPQTNYNHTSNGEIIPTRSVKQNNKVNSQNLPQAQPDTPIPTPPTTNYTIEYIIIPIILMLIFLVLVHPTTSVYLEKYIPPMINLKGYLIRALIFGILYMSIHFGTDILCK